jgi:cytoskeletal protein CcmA (bactofilin family)
MKGSLHMNRKFVVTVLGFSAALGLALCTVTTVARAGDHSKVLGSVDVQPGEHTGDVSTVNGSVHIGEDAVVGNASTVNGGVHMDSRATASDVSSTNGGIDVRDGGHVNGDIHTVNGGLHVETGVEVTGNVGNVNGGIRVAGAHIRGSISTTNGSIDLGPNAHIDGDVTVEPDHSWHVGEEHPPRVIIEPGTVVKGRLHFERKVVLYVSDRATIGAVDGAQPIKFSGDHPPAE